MDKKIAGLLGAAAALTTVTTAAQAAPAQNTELSPATSYRDLLDPIPNALPVLKADDERLAHSRANEATRLAQVSVQVGHHHITIIMLGDTTTIIITITTTITIRKVKLI